MIYIYIYDIIAEKWSHGYSCNRNHKQEKAFWRIIPERFVNYFMNKIT